MDRPPIPLRPVQIGLASPEFDTIAHWPFADQFVPRLLRTDIPDRAKLGWLQVWIYLDPDGQGVGFGTVDLADDHSSHTGGLFHPYIPLLAVNPTIPSRGYGTSILQHLIGQGAVIAHQNPCQPDLYLDVYTTSLKAIALYEKLGFIQVNVAPIPDPLEGGLTYNIMARRAKMIAPRTFPVTPFV